MPQVEQDSGEIDTQEDVAKAKLGQGGVAFFTHFVPTISLH